MIRKRRNKKEIPTPKIEVGKTKLTIRYYYLENIVSRVSSYFPIGGYALTRTLLKCVNVHKVQTAQKFDSKNKTNGTTTEVTPWNDQ